ncbi:hypothetical protein ACFLVX_05210 [Chloroflexota bacterium]
MIEGNFRSIVSNINIKAEKHAIGDLARIRKELKGKSQLPRAIFPKPTTFDTYAFHYGGRKELQFNIGWEGDDHSELRYGVAFSLETNQTLPNIDVLIPKIGLFNDFLQLYSEEYGDMRMWHYKNGLRSTDYIPGSISPNIVTEGVFIFLGNRQNLSWLDHELILNDLDRLLPLYKYVESNGNLPPILTISKEPFKFRPGFTSKASTAEVSQTERQLNITLRHNTLQEALCEKLVKKYGDRNVSAEQPNGAGTSIDAVVRLGTDFWFYEIKTANSPRACLRQAIGQLLEYAFWPGAQQANRLIVVGEKTLDEEGKQYLQILKKRFQLPVSYEHISV